MTGARPSTPRRRGEYGIDGGLNAILGLTVAGAAGAALLGTAVTASRTGGAGLALVTLLAALLLLQVPVGYLYSTRRGKFVAWARLLAEPPLRGDERVLDMGCGRGAILGLAASLVPDGRVVGLDLWRSSDQTGNSPEAARRNLRAEGVEDRCELQTGDMTAMPFPDSTFDLVVSNLAVHNVPLVQRLCAVDEAVRVLKPGGRLVIADLMSTPAYAARLRLRLMSNVEQRRPGWRLGYGMLGLGVGVVTASKPLSGSKPPTLTPPAETP